MIDWSNPANQITNVHANLLSLFQIVDQLPKEERALLTKNKTFIIPNVMEEARIFEWAGISFGEEETYKLSKALKVRRIIFHLCSLETRYIEWSS